MTDQNFNTSNEEQREQRSRVLKTEHELQCIKMAEDGHEYFAKEVLTDIVKKLKGDELSWVYRGWLIRVIEEILAKKKSPGAALNLTGKQGKKKNQWAKDVRDGIIHSQVIARKKMSPSKSIEDICEELCLEVYKTRGNLEEATKLIRDYLPGVVIKPEQTIVNAFNALHQAEGYVAAYRRREKIVREHNSRQT